LPDLPDAPLSRIHFPKHRDARLWVRCYEIDWVCACAPSLEGVDLFVRWAPTNAEKPSEEGLWARAAKLFLSFADMMITAHADPLDKDREPLEFPQTSRYCMLLIKGAGRLAVNALNSMTHVIVVPHWYETVFATLTPPRIPEA
jgi:hypothetical protein